MSLIYLKTSRKCGFFLMTHQFAVILISFLPLVWSDFRFCHKGPHRIKDTDCPGGFYSTVPIDISCSAYAFGENLHDGAEPELVTNYCTAPDPISLPGDLQNPTEFQEFYVKDGDSAGELLSVTEFQPADTCEDSCLAEWRDPDELEPEEHLDDKPKPFNDTVAEQSEAAARKLTREVFMNLVMEDNFEEDDPQFLLPIIDPLYFSSGNSTEQRLIRLLAKSMQIALAQCSPYVEENFLRQILKAIIFLNKKNKKASVDIGIEEYNVIQNGLESCLSMQNTAFKLKGSQCENHHRVDAIKYLKTDKEIKYRIQQRSFVWNMYDPIVEAAYAVVDFVHGYCFGNFIMNLNHYHIFHVAMEGLFPETPVQKRWRNPTKLSKGDNFWNSVLDTPDIKNVMRNLDACAIAGYSVSPFKHRLERMFTPEDMLASPKYIQIPSESENGWTKTMAEYWSYYEGRGGFKSFASNWGYCLDLTSAADPDQNRNQTINDIMNESCKDPEADDASSSTTEAPEP